MYYYVKYKCTKHTLSQKIKVPVRFKPDNPLTYLICRFFPISISCGPMCLRGNIPAGHL